ncbi:hypothetical protein [Staphylococcus phage vB_StaM_SA1]|nr:hypothetical protein [Staphylococcus phage vB_StaM_SA1]
MILEKNKFYYNKNIDELFIIGKDESDINDKINKLYYKKLIETNLNYYSLHDDLYYNMNLRFDLIDNEDIHFSNMYNGVRKNISVDTLEFSYTKVKTNEVILQLETFISRLNDPQFLEVDKDSNSQGVSITMVKRFYEKDIKGYDQHENDLYKLSDLMDKMIKEENDGNIKIFIKGIDIFEPHAYFRELEDEREIKNILVEKNFK